MEVTLGAPNSYQLRLPPTFQALPTVYSDGCIICQDYSDIDEFARAVSLDKLSELYDRTKPDESGSLDAEDSFIYFDARKVLCSIYDLRHSHTRDRLSTAGMNQITALTNFGILSYDTTGSLGSCFRAFAFFPIKNEKDRYRYEEHFEQLFEKFEEDIDKANSKAEKERIDAKFEAEKQVWAEMQTVYEWLQVTGRVALVEAVAEGLWFGYVAAKSAKQQAALAIPWKDLTIEERHGRIQEKKRWIHAWHKDEVAQARLFFAWLAYSIEYDRGLADGPREAVAAARPTADMLYTGMEVCRGYAFMFMEFFNTLRRNGSGTAKKIYGLSRDGGGPQGIKNPYAAGMGHAWNAFPYKPPNSNAEVYKTIDVTWAAPRQRGLSLDPTWWMASNSSFGLSHIPEKIPEEYFAPCPGTSTAKLWEQRQPYFPGSGPAYLVDLSTVVPFSNPITQQVGQDLRILAHFSNNCRHQAQLPCPFKLGFKADMAAKSAQGSTVQPDKSGDFQFFADAYGPRGIWKGDIILDKKSPGALMIYSEFVNHEGVTRYPKLVVWDVDMKNAG